MQSSDLDRSVATIRIVFIPSEDIDYDGLEIEQEWVDLSNWAADYYVPVQVDLENDVAGKFIEYCLEDLATSGQ